MTSQKRQSQRSWQSNGKLASSQQDDRIDEFAMKKPPESKARKEKFLLARMITGQTMKQRRDEQYNTWTEQDFRARAVI